jgi:hypothetical protein
MKQRSELAITMDLFQAGMELTLAKEYARAAGLTSSAARRFLKESKLPDISADVEKRLFENDYLLHVDDTARIRKFNSCESWYRLNPAIREVLVDLRYRGDLTNRSISFIWEAVARNDVERFAEKISDRAHWKKVPKERFRRRVEFLTAHIERGNQRKNALVSF